MSERKRPNSGRNLDIAIERMVEGRGDPLRTRAALAAAIVAQMLPGGVVKGRSALKLRFVDAPTRLTRRAHQGAGVPTTLWTCSSL